MPFFIDHVLTFANDCHLFSPKRHPKNRLNHHDMITKTNFKRIRGLQLLKSTPLILLLLQGKQVLAQAAPPAKASEGVSVLEILGYVGMIVGVILLAWVIGSAQSKGSSKASANTEVSHRPQRHFDHPNDPHFRKLKKKTS